MTQNTETRIQPLKRWMKKRNLKADHLAVMCSAVARKQGKQTVKSGAVTLWLRGTSEIIAERCIQIEIASKGEVTAHQLRPDLYPVPWGKEPKWLQKAA